MRIFAIRDEADDKKRDLAYLFYYESEKRFYIELADEISEWELPMILSSFAKRGVRSINAYWSAQWVEQRIVPRERQNLGGILRENGLESYDELKLLELSSGRCAQDGCYIVPLSLAALPENIKERSGHRIEDVALLEGGRVLLFLQNGETRLCDLREAAETRREFKPILDSVRLYLQAKIEPGGHGLSWGDGLEFTAEELYEQGERLPLTLGDFRNFVRLRVVNTAEASEALSCTRQNIDDLIRRGRLHPVRTLKNDKLFLRSEIEQRRK